MQVNKSLLVTHNPRALLVYLIYRFVLSALLFMMFITNISGDVLGNENPRLYMWVSLFYVLNCLGSMFVFQPHQLINSLYRITFLLVLDVLCLLALIHASGGIESGLAYLLITFAAIGSIFLSSQVAIALAAFISIFSMAQTFFTHTGKADFTPTMFTTGVLGILVFSCALLFQYLTERIRKTSAEAYKQSQYAKQLQKLGQEIVKRMQTGIIVIDSQDRIVMINDSALRLLDLPNNKIYRGESVLQLSNLGKVIHQWRQHPVVGIPQIHSLRAEQEVRINFAELDFLEETGDLDASQTILYLEDHRALTQQAQRLKLGSLGRLTASIAHEIRNPLGAISHAAQLLSESDVIDTADKRLTEIIAEHSKRVNQIVESTLNLSRRKEANPELLELNDWLPPFIEELKTTNNYTLSFLSFNDDNRIKFDPIHLRQILTNLIDNGARYSLEKTGQAAVELRVGLNHNTDKTYLQVIDYGDGIDTDKIHEVFEPFYTTDKKGSGLGLFISKELCEINQSSLHYTRVDNQLSCFNIEFTHYQRVS